MASPWRDMSIPYTTEELEKFRKDFQSMPNYNKSDGSVSAEDIPGLCKSIGWYRTPAQIEKIQDFIVKNWNGRHLEDVHIRLASELHLPSAFARQLVQETDKDENGFISDDEFKSIVEYLALHDSTFSGKTFEDFVAEADTNKDGRVDLEEGAAWVNQQLLDSDKCTTWLTQQYPDNG